MILNKNELGYWFPRLVDAGIPVPKTEIIDAGENWSHLMGFFDDPNRFREEHAKAEAVIKPLAEAIRQAVPKIGGYPAFLRTGMGSGKHNWKKCCDLQDEAVEDHIVALVEWSELVGWGMLPWQFWCVRERLPVSPIAVLPRYGDMPLVREMRCFIEGGEVLCVHDYWPRDSIRDGLLSNVRGFDEDVIDEARDSEADRLYALATNLDMPGRAEVMRLARQVASIFFDDGCWSVDILESSRGPLGSFYVTDMALGHQSFHMPGCPNIDRIKKSEVP